jgi:two-component system phosphate regulon sensor histidine kinase PhoR
MIGLISDILKLSELESRASEIDRKSVSLLMIARKVAESLAVQAQEKQVEVRVEGNDGFLDANPDRMTQLVLNLLDNAVKYNVQGGRADVFVRTENDRVILTVADTGVGIPKEAQERVFERFYRVDKSRSRRLGGTGLGLSIVKHIVGLYKGKIRLRSEPGKGTEITVTLPVGP